MWERGGGRERREERERERGEEGGRVHLIFSIEIT